MSTTAPLISPQHLSAHAEDEAILIRRARVHNLKNISVTIPFNQLTVVTGVSGSGKSSLAFDTVYAEGQRRYVESLSAYARQFLERIDKPDVDEITGICPAIAVRQKNSARNPRSTVATQTEIHDYLRLLYARVGRTFCYQCGVEVKRDTPQSIADTVLELPEGTRFYVLFPAASGINFMPEVNVGSEDDGAFDDLDDSMIDESLTPDGGLRRRGKPLRSREASITPEDGEAELRRVKGYLMSLMQRGFTRLYRRGEIFELTTPDAFPFADFHETSVLVDRLVVRPDTRERLVDSLETAYREGNGKVEIQTVGPTAQQFRFSEDFECKTCHIGYPMREPRLFSFNNPYGACPTCQGFGDIVGLNLDLVVPNPKLTLEEGAIEPWTKSQFEFAQRELRTVCQRHKIPMTVAFHQLSPEHRTLLFEGTNGWGGIRGFFDSLEQQKYKMHIRVFLAKYRSYTCCPDCHGGRLRPEARAVRIGGKPIVDTLAMTIEDAADFFENLSLTTEELAIADRVLTEIRHRLRFLKDVGLEYLTLDRLTSSLSGGEAQRIQLATHLGSSLVGALYVLDEPSIGLHSRDGHRLIQVLQRLRDIGNTVLVVEHDPDMMLAADYLIDIGPGAGEFGGEVIFQGTLPELLKHPTSLTAKYLRKENSIKKPQTRRTPGNRKITISGAREHNLKDLTVEIPLGLMVCITGVSGSGKSTLVHDVLYRGLQREPENGKRVPTFEIDGKQYIDEVICVDQSPIGRTPRSNPATYLKVYDGIRELFAATREAQNAGWTASHFSFNLPGGRCETCQGDGTVTVEMQFLADVELMCDDCHGQRFRPEVLAVKYRGKSIHDVLNLTVREAISFFSNVKKISDRLKVLDEVGLGYLRLGQSATTLSGGEAQRIKLATFLSRPGTNRMLYIFDEPTTGLHFDDINKLLFAFRRLLDLGASLVIIEHNLDVIKVSDWVIDLGPEGGHAGGTIIGCGTPEDIAQLSNSHTGRFLGKVLTTA